LQNINKSSKKSSSIAEVLALLQVSI